MNPTAVQPAIFHKAKGLNDIESVVKLPDGFVPFALNMDVDNHTYDRRKGRDFSFLSSGNSVVMMASLTWDDGTTHNIAAMGAFLYDLSLTFTKALPAAYRMILQSPDATYWNITPDSNGFINPTSLTVAPTATPQTADLTINNGESFIFQRSAASTRITADSAYFGWYLLQYGVGTAITTYTDDIVFTTASGFTMKIIDSGSKTHSLSMQNTGELWSIMTP